MYCRVELVLNFGVICRFRKLFFLIFYVICRRILVKERKVGVEGELVGIVSWFLFLDFRICVCFWC